ncbi:reverse transcriptase domain-containing protein [Tanacetum coccineum]
MQSFTPVLANQLRLKNGLLNLVTAIAFHGFENDDPHSHIRRFTKITQTVKLNNVPSNVVKLLLFSFSLEGAAGTWFEKEPPNSITTWNDLVSKFVNRFFPPSKTTNLQNEITRLQQRFGETFAEAWDRFKDLLNNVPIMAFLLSIRLILYTIVYVNLIRTLLILQLMALHERPQGALPSNTEPNPREQVNSIMTRSGLTTAEPSIPPPVPPTPRVEVEKEPETLMDEVHITSPTSTAHVPPPGVQPVLIDALTQIPKFTKVLKDLLKDKEKLDELENTPINAECFAILLNKVLEKLEDPEKFLIPCILQDLEVYNSLADSGARLKLSPTEDVIIKVEKFNFLADFVIVDFEADARVPIILRRPFLRTARALVDLYEEKLTLRVGNEEVVFYTDKSLRNNSSNIQSIHCINIINFSRDKLISGSTTFPSDSSPSSPLVETSDSLLEEFADELALLDPFPPGNEDDNFDPEANLREIEYLLNRDPLTVSSPTNDIDVINPVLERFIDEPTLFYSSPLGDDDDDLFYLKSDNDEWKKILYGDSYNDTHSKNDKTKDSKTKSLINEANIESNILPP